MLAMAALLLLAGVPAFAPTASANGPGIKFGFQEDDYDEVNNKTDLPDQTYAAIWATKGNAGVQWQLLRARDRGQVPVVHWYYWRDSITPDCVEFGCSGLSKSEWYSMADQLASTIQSVMQGRRTIVTIEMEFNKQGIEGTYANTFERYLVDHVRKFNNVDGVETIVAFGEWGSANWHKFRDAVNESTLLGTQLLWVSGADTPGGHQIDQASNRTRNALKDLLDIFGPGTLSNKPKRTFIYDWGVSTWGQTSNWQYATIQANQVRQLRQESDTLRNYGLEGFVLRTIDDSGNPNERWGSAECCFGYANADVTQFKPSYGELKQWMVQERDHTGGDPGPGPGPGPGPEPSPSAERRSIEAESFAVKPTGASYVDATHSGNAGWNLWTTGHMEHTMYNPGKRAFLVTIVAKGDLAGPDPPHMRFLVNGALVAEWDVASSSLLPYRAQATLPSGNAVLRIEYTNDYLSGTSDRNLRLDVVHLDGLPVEGWKREAEAMTCNVGGSSVDATASGGVLWNLWGNGNCAATLSAVVGTPQDVRIVAKGDPAGGVWPRMQAYLDGVLVGDWSVDSDQWRTYAAKGVGMAAGNRALEIRYVNDGSVGTDDRNLLLDAASAWVTPATWAREADAFTTRTTGGKEGDARASAGAVWNLWANGHVETSLTSPGGAFVLRVDARGTPASGAWPIMRAFVDGVQVREWTVDSTTARPYVVPVTLTSGTHTLRLQYVNDLLTSTEDRNLILDHAALWAAPDRAWMREAEAMTCNPGQQSADGGASGALYWNLWGNGACASTLTTTASGPHEVRVVARGDPAGGVWPIMEGWVGGTRVATWTVGVDQWRVYTATVDLPAGSHAFEVRYVNDGLVGTDDRNLHVDVASAWA